MTRGTVVRRLLMLCAGLLVAAGAGAAGLYKWVDSEGNVQYSQNPPPSGDYKKMAPPPPAATQPADAEKQLEQDKDALTPAPPPAAEIEQERQQKTLSARQCENARKNLDIYTNYRRVRDEKGEVVVLTDEERKIRIKEMEKIIKESCK